MNKGHTVPCALDKTIDAYAIFEFCRDKNVWNSKKIIDKNKLHKPTLDVSLSVSHRLMFCVCAEDEPVAWEVYSCVKSVHTSGCCKKYDAQES